MDTMSWRLVPLIRKDLDFFSRQRDLFPHWLGEFDEDWRTMRFEDSVKRFEHQLERCKKDMCRLDSDVQHVTVGSGFVAVVFVDVVVENIWSAMTFGLHTPRSGLNLIITRS